MNWGWFGEEGLAPFVAEFGGAIDYSVEGTSLVINK